MSAEIQVDVTPTGYRLLGQECATPAELFALLAEHKVTAVELLPGDDGLVHRFGRPDPLTSVVPAHHGLVPEGDVTRLLSRNRITVKGGVFPHLASTYLMEPGSLVMERKMLLRIRQRAERAVL